MKITCISDLHGNYPELPGGDLLIVAGDCTTNDQDYSWHTFYNWLSSQSYKKKIYIGGNHDNRLTRVVDQTPSECDATYLFDSGTDFEGLKIWGSPWTKTFPGQNPKCKAFTVDTEEELGAKWDLIPKNTDILITHSPPVYSLDETVCGKCVGSHILLIATALMPNLKLHVFGHIHESYGYEYDEDQAVHLINASHVNERYQPVNKPIEIEI